MARVDAKQAFVALGSLAGTGILLVLVFSLGSWGFKHRQASLHAGRLQRLTAQHPTADQVQAGLEMEGGRLVGQASAASELPALAARWAPSDQAVVTATGRRFPQTRVFLVGNVHYFVFFSEDGLMRDFAVIMPE
jgi:hypothetical protein